MESKEQNGGENWLSMRELTEEDLAMREMLLKKYGKDKLRDLIQTICQDARMDRKQAIHILHDKELGA